MSFSIKAGQPNSAIHTFSEIIFKECYDRVFKNIYAITMNRERTEDIVQEAFYKALKNIESLKAKEKFCSWVTTIALNEMRDEAKKYNRQRALEDGVSTETAATQESEFEAIDEKLIVQESLASLNDQDREILVMNYYLDFSIERISKYYQITPNNTRVKLHRAKTRLKQVFAPIYQEGGSI